MRGKYVWRHSSSRHTINEMHVVVTLPDCEVVDCMNNQIESDIRSVRRRHSDEEIVTQAVTNFNGFGAKRATHGRIFLSSPIETKPKYFSVCSCKMCGIETYIPLTVSSSKGICHDSTLFCCLTTTRMGLSLKAIVLPT